MAINIVDRRKNPKGKSSENRQRLLKRVDAQIKKALPDIVKNTNVKDLTSSKEKIKIPIPKKKIVFEKNKTIKKKPTPEEA